MGSRCRRLGWALFLPVWLAGAEDRLQLKARSVETIEDPYDYLAAPPKRRAGSRSHLILQFRAPPSAAQVEELGRRGMTVLEYVPDSALLVAADDSPMLEGLEVRWAGRLRWYDKLSPQLAESAAADQPVVLVVTFHRDVDPAEAQALVRDDLLEIRPHPDLLPGQLLVEGPLERVMRLSEWEEVSYIYPASQDLVEGRRVYACWGPGTPLGPVGEYVARVGDGWDGPGRNPVALAYFFQRITAKLPEAQVRSEIVRALNEWSKYVLVSFAAAASEAEPRSIDILFARGAHGDAYPFDGRGKMLAHTFYPSPPNSEPIAGDMHLDDDEDWAIGNDTDLFTVVLHELGHALGLGHSDKPGAVLYPYYHRVTALTAEDISAIRELYATRESTPETPPANPTPTTPTLPPPPPPANPTPTPPATPPPTPPANPTPTPPSTPPSTPSTPSSPDKVAPALVITSPASTSVLTYASSIVLRGTASDKVGVVEVTWSDSLGASGRAQGTTNWVTGDLPLREGANTLTIRARDAAGNVGWRSVVVTRRRR